MFPEAADVASVWAASEEIVGVVGIESLTATTGADAGCSVVVETMVVGVVARVRDTGAVANGAADKTDRQG